MGAIKPDLADRVKRRFTRSGRASRHATSQLAAYPLHRTPTCCAAPVTTRSGARHCV